MDTVLLLVASPEPCVPVKEVCTSKVAGGSMWNGNSVTHLVDHKTPAGLTLVIEGQ